MYVHKTITTIQVGLEH